MGAIEIIILGVVGLIVLAILAFMAEAIELDLGIQPPRMNLKFKKDSKLFGFLKGKDSYSSAQETNSDSKIDYNKVFNNGYHYKLFMGKTEIQYGTEAYTYTTHEITLIADNDNVDKFYYYNSDGDYEIQPLEGFNLATSEYKRLNTFGSWETVDEIDGFRISLPIKKMLKEEERKLKYVIRKKVSYLEVVEDSPQAKHGFAFRMTANVKSAYMEFRIPNGQLSHILKFTIFSKMKGDVLFEKEINSIEDMTFQLGQNYGIVLVVKDGNETKISWTVNRELKAGQICKINWITLSNNIGGS